MDYIASHVVIPGAVADVQPGPGCDDAKGDCPRVAVPDDQDQFHEMEEQVHRIVAECLRGALPAYLPTTDNDSGADDETPAQPRKKNKETSGKLRTADTSDKSSDLAP